MSVQTMSEADKKIAHILNTPQRVHDVVNQEDVLPAIAQGTIVKGLVETAVASGAKMGRRLLWHGVSSILHELAAQQKYEDNQHSPGLDALQ